MPERDAITRATAFDDLTPKELGAWSALLKREAFLSPFLAPEFCKAANQVSGRVFVASLGLGDDAVLLPFRRRAYFSGIADKVGRHMSDWCGMIGAEKTRFNKEQILEAAGLSVFCFDHLPRWECPSDLDVVESLGIRFTVENSETYFADLRIKDRKFVNEVERLEKQLSESSGKVRFEWHSPRSEIELERLIDEKRKQYRESNADDALESHWSKNLLRTLLAIRSPDFEAVMSTIYCGDNWIASHFGLRYGNTLHIWFPVYNSEFRRFGPGHILLFKIIRHAASIGIREFDFGLGVAPYKRKYGGKTYTVTKGNLIAGDYISFAHSIAQSIKWRFQKFF
jgi:CelD/BcsL family acetyltransferase involved in cellulose biosynthesis